MSSPRCNLGLARAMRKAPAFHEAILWKLLRDRRLAHLKFRRQVPLGRYIADFLCLEHRIIVEADGPLHDPAKDAERDAWLTGQGVRVLRFSNATVLASPGLVLTAILDAVTSSAAPSSGAPRHLLPRGEKEICRRRTRRG